MPKRSQDVILRIRENGKESDRVYFFHDRDKNRLAITFEDLIFLDGVLLHQSYYRISHDDGIILLSPIEPSRLQAIKF